MNNTFRPIVEAMGDFKRLLVWRKAHALGLNCHRVASTLSGSGLAALRSQLTRAALSIPTNIVEGHGQASKRDFARFLGYAINSASELEYHLIFARGIEAIAPSDFTPLHAQLVEVRKMLHGLKRSLGRTESGHPAARHHRGSASMPRDKPCPPAPDPLVPIRGQMGPDALNLSD